MGVQPQLLKSHLPHELAEYSGDLATSNREGVGNWGGVVGTDGSFGRGLLLVELEEAEYSVHNLITGRETHGFHGTGLSPGHYFCVCPERV